jgi:transglutaminase-like putative cysteine protease
MDTLTLRRAAAAPAADTGPPGWVAPAAAAALAGAAAAGGLALSADYTSPLPTAAVLALWAVAGVALTLLLRRRLPPPAALLAGVPVALAGTVLLAVWAPGTRGDPLLDALSALPHAGGRLISGVPPLPVMVDTLAFPALATWLAGAAGALAWSSGRALAALVPGAVLLVGASVVGGSGPAAFWAAALLACSAAVLLALSADGDRPDEVAAGGVRAAAEPAGGPGTSGRRWAARLLGCAAAAAAVAVAAPLALGGWQPQPYDVRDGVRPQVAPQPVLNPLGYLSVWASQPDTPLMTVRSDRVTELRWVALAEFTGTTWLPENEYRATGRMLPPADPEPPHATRQEATVAVDALPGPWLPVVGSPTSLGVAGAGYDPASGTAVALGGTAAGTTYDVAGDVAHWRPEELTDLAPPEGEAFDRYLALPEGLPPQVAAITEQATAEGTPYEHAVALARYLRSGYTFDPGAPSGHGTADLARLLVAPGERGGGGTSEQFASAFAVLARAAGLPSRVAVGFDAGTEAADGEFTVTTGDAIAWGEVYFAGVGWVPFDVTPGGREEGDVPGEPSAARPDAGAAAPPGADGAAAHEVADPPRSPDAGAGTTLVAVGAAVAAAAAAVGGTAALRVSRSRRRTAPGRPGADRVLGAWRELREALRLAGTPAGSGGTVTDVVRAAARADPTAGGARRLRYLHRSVNALAFDASGGVADPAVENCVTEVREYVRDLRAGQRRFRRWTWWLDPRPLFWRAP